MLNETPDTLPAPPSEALAAGRYLIGRRLGSGGMAAVYEARDLRLNRPVAVKVLTGLGRDEQAVGRFLEETRLPAKLRHPHLTPLLDAGIEDSHHFLVMPLVEGPTLADRLRIGPVSPAEVRRIGVALAEALAYVHRHDIVHRDVKPSNVLLGPRGDIRLADSGAAHAPDGPALTATNCVVGTAGYLAPEQAEGRGATAASDVYALGLVLLEALRGEREYRGSPTERAIAALSRPPEAPASLGRGWRRLMGALTGRSPTGWPSAGTVLGGSPAERVSRWP